MQKNAENMHENAKQYAENMQNMHESMQWLILQIYYPLQKQFQVVGTF